MSLDDEFSELIYGRKIISAEIILPRAENTSAQNILGISRVRFHRRGAMHIIRRERRVFAGAYKTPHGCRTFGFDSRRRSGLYGSMPGGTLKTFERGGSDITGAILASAARLRRIRKLDGRVGIYVGRSENG